METEYIKDDGYAGQMKNTVVAQLHSVRKRGYFKARDGIKLYTENYINPDERAVVFISHGFCEFAEKFEEVIYYFFNQGYSVYILEHRGHGYSGRLTNDNDRSKVYVGHYSDYVRDMGDFMRHVVIKAHPGKKRILYAHSMGGAIGALTLEKYPKIFDCAVLSSPMLKMRYDGVPEVFTWFLRIYAKLFPVSMNYAPGQQKFTGDGDWQNSCCTSKERYEYFFEKRKENKRYQTNAATYGWSVNAIKMTDLIQKHVDRIKVPVLLLQAGHDNVVNNKGQNRLTAKNKNVTLIKMPEAKHEIYNSKCDTLTRYYKLIWHFLDKYI